MNRWRLFCLFTIFVGFSDPSIALNEGDLPKQPYFKSTLFRGWPSYFKGYVHPRYSNFSWLFSTGFSVYSGDLSKPTHFSRQNNYLTPNLGIGINYRLTNYVSLRLEGAWFRLYADAPEGFWSDTGFKSSNFEYYAAIVHNLFPKQFQESVYKRFDPYIFAGIGSMVYNPQLNPEAIAPLPERMVASGSSRLIPLGIGINYYWRGHFFFTFEAGYRITQTDWLDTASSSNDPNPSNDNYYIYRFKVNIQPRKGFLYKRYLKRKR